MSALLQLPLTPAAERLAASIAREHGLPVGIMLSRARHPSIVEARDHFIAVLAWSTAHSTTEIAAFLGRDHSGIIDAVGRHEARLNGEPEMVRYGGVGKIPRKRRPWRLA